MRKIALLALLPLAAATGQTVVIETTLGEIEVRLEAEKAPNTVRNFLQYVRDGRYAGGQFHRTVLPDNQPQSPVKIEVIQAGAKPGSKSEDPIMLERTSITGLRHLDGVISMARSGPDTATSNFFLCIGAQPELDFGGLRNPDGQGFAAFGRVTRGMDVVRKIQKSPHEAQKLAPPVAIISIRER